MQHTAGKHPISTSPLDPAHLELLERLLRLGDYWRSHIYYRMLIS